MAASISSAPEREDVQRQALRGQQARRHEHRIAGQKEAEEKPGFGENRSTASPAYPAHWTSAGRSDKRWSRYGGASGR